MGSFSPNRIVSDICHATVSLTFIIGAPKPSQNSYGAGVAKKFSNPAKNIVLLRDSCQIVRPIAYSELPTDCKKNIQGG